MQVPNPLPEMHLSDHQMALLGSEQCSKQNPRGLLTKLVAGPRLLSLRFCRSAVRMENFISNKFRGVTMTLLECYTPRNRIQVVGR